MPLRYINRIPLLLGRPDRDALTEREIAELLSVDRDTRDILREALDSLESQERIIHREDGRYELPRLEDEVEGTIRIARKGFGFVIPDTPSQDGDIFIPPMALGGAISGDRVRISITRRRGFKGKGPSGRVEEILHRRQTTFAGTIRKRGKAWLIDPDGRALRASIIVRDPHARSLRAGDKVAFELVADPDGDMLGEGVVTEVLGEAGKPDVETSAVVAAYGLRTTFPDEVLDGARAAASSFERWREDVPAEREDLTGQIVFTIDPPDARDFDDAISISWDEDSQEWTLGVHIADVSHFVECGEAMDVEAMARGNSAYLPRLVIPMLPEILSNGVCSLQEGVNRFCKSAFMTFDKRGRVIGQRFASTVIRSCKRLTYLEAQAIIGGNMSEARKHMRSETQCPEEVVEALKMSDALARTLRKRRLRDGMIVLDLPQAELFFDDEGHVSDIQPEDDAFTHTIIEMFMVEANEAVARLFEGLETPVLRRIHPEPELDDVEHLRIIAVGVGIRLSDKISRADLQQLLQKTAGTPSSQAVHFAVLRTLTKAEYSPAPIGHFALASQAYAHFTSPIRRYPDLVVHRALQVYLEATKNGTAVIGGRKRAELIDRLRGDTRFLGEVALVELGRHCTETEGNAEQAERELRQFLVLQYLETHVLGDEVPGVITGFNAAGVWVVLDRYLVDGLVTWDAMGTPGNSPDRWIQIEGTGRIVASRSGAVLSIGDPVTVQVLRVDPANRDMELVLKDRPNRTAKSMPSPPKSFKRGKGKGKGKGKGRHRGR